MSISPELYSLINNLAKENKITRSELLKRSLKQYIASERRWKELRRWSKESAERMNIKEEQDIERIVDECRIEQNR